MVPRGGAALAIPAGIVVFMNCPWTTLAITDFALPTYKTQLSLEL